jgi:NADPH2:quinone reductase
LPEWAGTESNEGDDIAGIVHELGKDVSSFQVGDRGKFILEMFLWCSLVINIWSKVTAFHQMRTPGGSYAEYAVAWDYTTIHIPSHITFEQASTLPLAVLTAAVGLYESRNLGLNNPWDPAINETPLVVYGGASAVGAYAIQLAKKSKIRPIITVAGRGIPFVEGIIDRSKGDTIVDYRDGDEAVVEGIKKALGGKKLFYAYDAVSEKGLISISRKLLRKEVELHLFCRGRISLEISIIILLRWGMCIRRNIRILEECIS